MAHILILVHAELVGFVQSLWRQGHGPVGANIAYFVIPDLIRDPTFLRVRGSSAHMEQKKKLAPGSNPIGADIKVSSPRT